MVRNSRRGHSTDSVVKAAYHLLKGAVKVPVGCAIPVATAVGDYLWLDLAHGSSNLLLTGLGMAATTYLGIQGTMHLSPILISTGREDICMGLDYLGLYDYPHWMTEFTALSGVNMVPFYSKDQMKYWSRDLDVLDVASGRV